MLAAMTWRQLQGWYAYYGVEPFGEDIEWLRHGASMSLLANINRDTTKQAKPFDAYDFMPFAERPEAAKVDQAAAWGAFVSGIVKLGIAPTEN